MSPEPVFFSSNFVLSLNHQRSHIYENNHIDSNVEKGEKNNTSTYILTSFYINKIGKTKAMVYTNHNTTFVEKLYKLI